MQEPPLEGCPHNYEPGSDDFESCIAVFSCSCGSVLGVIMCPEAESLDMFYQAFATRFLPLIKRLGPDRPLLIVYDNACRLWAYINKRNPALAARIT